LETVLFPTPWYDFHANLYITVLGEYCAISVTEYILYSYTYHELNDNLKEHALLLRRVSFYQQRLGLPYPPPHCYPSTTSKWHPFGNHCHLAYIPVTKKNT
jgi:hypothetical protein